MKTSSRLTFGLCALLLLACGVLYGNYLWNPIVFDDLPFFTLDQAGNMPVADMSFSFLELRSLPYATLAWTKQWFGLDLIWFRIGNLLIHAGVVISLFFFVRTLACRLVDSGPDSQFRMTLAAFFAALLFAIHPASVYAVGYLVQRNMLFATLFGIWALLAYLHGTTGQKPLLLWLAVLLYYFAVFSKEHVIMLPAVMMALTFLLVPAWPATLKRQWPLFLAMALIAVFAIQVRKHLIGVAYELNSSALLGKDIDKNLVYPLSVLTQSALYFKYCLLWLLPNPNWMSIDMRENFARSFASLYALGPLAFLAWGGLSGFLLSRRKLVGLVGFAMLVPWVLFFTEFTSVRVQEIFVLYRSYVWATGLVCALPFLFQRFNWRGLAIACGVLCLVLFAIANERLTTFSHSLLLWDDAEKLVADRDDAIGADRIYYNRGRELAKARLFDQAEKDYLRAVTLAPDFYQAYNNLADTYIQKKNFPAAIDAYNKAIAITTRLKEPSDYHHYLGRAKAHEGMGHMAEAKADYAESCRLAQKGCAEAEK